MTRYHANGCGGVLKLVTRGQSPELSTWRCSKCKCYTNEIATTKEIAVAAGEN